ncbi:MAG: hypothetical protein QXZ68_06730 [Candidatus Bathyarchaeia archaeon]
MPTITLRPNAAGDLTQLTPVGATYNWDCVDDETPDDDTTYVRSSPTSDALLSDLYNIPDPPIHPGSTINSVTVVARCRSESSIYPSTVAILIKTHGSLYTGPPVYPPTTYTNYNQTWTNNPYTNQPWTIEEINALQIGVQIASGVIGDIYFPGRATQVYAVIDYTPPPTIETLDEGVGYDVVEVYEAKVIDDEGVGYDATQLTTMMFTTDEGSGLEYTLIAITVADFGLGQETTTVTQGLALEDAASGFDEFMMKVVATCDDEAHAEETAEAVNLTLKMLNEALNNLINITVKLIMPLSLLTVMIKAATPKRKRVPELEVKPEKVKEKTLKKASETLAKRVSKR